MKLEVYGWAAWTPKGAVLSLRNPSEKPASITLDADAVFELPEGAPKEYRITSSYDDQRLKSLDFRAGKPVSFDLEPFEFVVFDASPVGGMGKR